MALGLPSTVVEVRVLGPVELIDGAVTVRLPPAERTVLAALASRLGERVAVDVLVEALWPNKAPPSARKTLQVYVTRLRHGVGVSAIVERSAGYLLDPDQVSVDATRAATMVATAREVFHGGDRRDSRRIVGTSDDTVPWRTL